MPNSSSTVTARTPVQLAAMVVGAAFLLVGVLGFIPGITTNYDTLEWAGHHSEAQLLGLFNVSILHNLVHLAFGVVGLIAGANPPAARSFLIGGGVIYLVLWIYGLVIDQNSDANFVPLDTADNWLHFGLGLAMIALGVILPRKTSTGQHLSGRQPGIIE
ncbi:membrane protein [Nocardia cyriacigeorgica]|uniref:DUF4383 domain-containing protein n=1 Tax=Nocardia cyriacigeorgica (strain GUH-2) TaxID=1127134 RepID=H6RA16_NOCCG|nr:membrane protein [Nocardia cyriacigeorgica]BDU05523.1 membrane protein [Nocardia cyriacigeorgica]CCF62421.1 conserved membrane protein of unknown function [Nocardia cyriacigeorgica GUH-2]